jgi:hypothetical protein
MTVVEDVRAGRAQVEFAEVVARGDDGTELRIDVIRDALKIDGVRVSANARDLQTIADMIGCLLLTPKVIDLVYEQASLRFDPIVRADGNIVALSTSKRVSGLIDAAIAARGGDPGGLIDSVGKYWVLHNHLATPSALKYGLASVCNYGWLGTNAGFPALTAGLRCWQTPGFQHDDSHTDPSQLVRLMRRKARLRRPSESEQSIDLLDALRDAALAPLLNHDGVLRYLRVASVPESPPLDPLVLSPYNA